MKLILKNVRMAFPEIWEPKAFSASDKGDPACSAKFIIDKNDPQLALIKETLKKVAIEKWADKAKDMLGVLQAKGDIFFHDGATMAEYDGFAGNFYVGARNKARPKVVAKQRFQGKPVELNANGDAFVDGVKVNVPFKVTAPYSGCYVNVSMDVWAQANDFGKRINAKLLAIQFEADGAAFGGGEGFASADFDDTSVEAGADEAFGFEDSPKKDVWDDDIPF